MDEVTQQIIGTIKTAQALPNGKERNKVISKLEDALAWAKMSNTAPITAGQPTTAPLPNGNCVCPFPGVRDRDCMAAVHK